MNPMNNAAVAYVHHDHNRLNGNPGIAVEVRVQLVSVGAPLGIVMRLQSDDVLARGGCGRRCEEPVKKDYVTRCFKLVMNDRRPFGSFTRRVNRPTRRFTCRVNRRPSRVLHAL